MYNIITVKANWKLHFNAENIIIPKQTLATKGMQFTKQSITKTKQNKNSKLQAAQSTGLKFSPKNNWP